MLAREDERRDPGQPAGEVRAVLQRPAQRALRVRGVREGVHEGPADVAQGQLPPVDRPFGVQAHQRLGGQGGEPFRVPGLQPVDGPAPVVALGVAEVRRYAAEDQAGDPAGVAPGAAEGDGRAVGEAEEVDPVGAQVVQDAGDGGAQEAVPGAGRQRVGAAHAGQVEGDHGGVRAEVLVHLRPAVDALEGAAEDDDRFGPGRGLRQDAVAVAEPADGEGADDLFGHGIWSLAPVTW